MLLDPYLGRIYGRFPEAMLKYQDEYPASVRAEHEDRTAAGCVRDHAWGRISTGIY